MAVKEYFDWIEEEACYTDTGSGLQEFVFRAGPLVVEGIAIPEPDDFDDMDEWSEKHTEALAAAGALLIEKFDDFMIDGRPVTNVEMFAISYWHWNCDDAIYQSWINGFLNWIGASNGNGNCSSEETEWNDSLAEGHSDDC